MKDGMLEFSDWPMFDLLMTDKELCREVDSGYRVHRH